MHNTNAVREIRRYRNRRLYDLGLRRTITMRELSAIVREGHRVRVTEHATGEDITVAVLGGVAQQEVACWASKEEGADLYRSIIARSTEMSKKAFHNVMLAGLGALDLTREKAEEIIDALIKRGELSKTDRKHAIEELIEKAEDQARKFTDTMKQKASEMRGVRRAEYDNLKSEVESLRDQIAGLKEELAGR